MRSYEARSLLNFIQRLAANYISRGYFFCVEGEIPARKDPVRTDAKIVMQYGVASSKWAKARQRRRGEASIQYLRYRRHFAILATRGEHRFFKDEAARIQDVRRVPFKIGGYSISYREWHGKGHAVVRIERQRFCQLREYLLKRASRASVDDLVAELQSFAFPPFAPVRRQLVKLVWRLNESRRRGGLESVPVAAVLPLCGRNSETIG